MAEPTIICPNCKNEIKLTESLAAPLLEASRNNFREQLAAKDEEVAVREAKLATEQEALRKERSAVDATIVEKLKSERQTIADEERKRANLALGADLEQKDRDITNLQEILADRDRKLTEAQKAQAELVRKERELADAKREMELTIQKQVQGELATVRDKARSETADEMKLKLAERDETIGSMTKQIEELRRRAEQGSQQLQGEVQELELEALLRARFPHDRIDPVAKGEHGGDCLQLVFTDFGQACGTILWESKRTKAWSDAWLRKLRADQRAAKADVAIIISQTLPKGTETFEMIDGVWVAATRFALPLAIVLRHSLVDLAASRQASEGQQTKTAMVYQYLTGPRFTQRVQAIVEAFSSMREDLDRERRAAVRQWAKREIQIEGVMTATAGMYGDLQGIAGKSLRELEGLDVGLLGEGEADAQDEDGS